MGHVNIQHPETKLWRCFSTVVDDWLCDWMSEDDYKEWLIDDAVASMREEFEQVGIKASTWYSYNELVYEVGRQQWKETHCSICSNDDDCDLCFIYKNDWKSYAEHYADNDILGIIPELVIPEGE